MAYSAQTHLAQDGQLYKIPEEHKAIDEQITIIRGLVSGSPPDASQLISALRRLLDLTKSHFEHEEIIMTANHFPGILLHKRDHDYLVESLNNFTKSVVDETVALSPQIAENLQSWLSFHIKKYDDAYLEFRSVGGRES